MKATIYEKTISGDRFYIKPMRMGYFAIINRLDYSQEALCSTKEEAETLCEELNSLRRNK